MNMRLRDATDDVMSSGEAAGVHTTCESKITEAEIATAWPVPDSFSHKYTRGVVGLNVGSHTYPGAALLSAGGALALGPGMVRYLGPREVGILVLPAFPEIVLERGRLDACVIGSGIPGGELTRLHKQVSQARQAGVPCVLDAAGLEFVTREGDFSGCVLTPHPGEAARIFTRLGHQRQRSDIEDSPTEAARELAALTGSVVLLKGGTDRVASPSGRVLLAPGGSAWRGTAGAGDVLAGAVGATLAIAHASGRLDIADASKPPVPHGETRDLTFWAAAALALHVRASSLAAGQEPGHPIRSSEISTFLSRALGSILTRNGN